LRVHELAKELGVASKELLASLKEMGIDGLTASSSVPDQAVPRLRASGGKAVPEAKIKEAVEEPLPTSRPRKRKEVLEPETPPAAPKPAPVAEPEPPTPAAEAAPSVEPPPAPEPAGPSLRC
jgi:translation initiation factor IF-2